MDDLSNIVNNVFIQFQDNPYALNRLTYYVNNLSLFIASDLINYEKRLTRTNELTAEYDIFCNVFLSKHKYYYLPNNNCFYEYNDKTYQNIKEDDIHYNLLSTITVEGKLTQWKHKTKLHIIKLIKDRNIFKSIPESYTIQAILGFLQTTIFSTKNAAKYFLTVLGDNLLKKNNNCIYFIKSNSNMKKFLQLIDEIAYMTVGTSITNNFLSKHHETHNLTNYRLIKTHDIQISYDVVKDMLNKLGMDLLCVASHYSQRYQNAETFLTYLKDDQTFTSHLMFLTNNSIDVVIDGFVEQCFVKGNEESFCISWKNMHYIWKLYLSSIHIPNMIYYNNLKEILKTKLNYKEENDVFINITSKYLPQISIFLQFWETYVLVIHQEETNTNTDYSESEYEIDELIMLFKSVYPSSNMGEEDVLKIIKHFFYPNVTIKNDKYITNIKCSLWDKSHDINLALNHYKEMLKNELTINDTNLNTSISSLISFDELYHQYHSYCKAFMYVNKVNCLIVSKHYFEKYIEINLKDYIQFEKFIDKGALYSSFCPSF